LSPQTNVYVPESWLESTLRAISEYVKTGLNNSVIVSGNPVGLYTPTNLGGIYELIMEFPSPETLREKVPLPRTLVHFEIDAIDDRILGMGKNELRTNLVLTPGSESVNPQEGREHRVNFDVGVWTSDRAGGSTARLRVYEILTNLFHGSRAQKALDSAVNAGDGRIEILQFSGGRFLTETINDITTYRTIDGNLEVRVFSRTPLGIPGPAITDIEQAPNLTIAP
jgi:hypothetical protein